MEQRLQKILADAGIGSRRGCEKLIVEGRVTVNRATVKELGARADAERDAVAVGLDVAFGPELGPVGGVLSDTISPFTGAETVAESTACHAQSMPLRSSYSCKHSRHNSWNTPERTHPWKWRWADEPDPYSRGIIFHWHPVRSTYRMPLKTIRCGLGRRPPFGPIGWSVISGERIFQNSSGIRCSSSPLVLTLVMSAIPLSRTTSRNSTIFGCSSGSPPSRQNSFAWINGFRTAKSRRNCYGSMKYGLENGDA